MSLTLFFPPSHSQTHSLSHSHSHTNSFSLSFSLKAVCVNEASQWTWKLLSSFFLLNHPLLCSLSLIYVYIHKHTHTLTHIHSHTHKHTHRHTSCFKDASSVFDWLYYLMKLFRRWKTHAFSNWLCFQTSSQSTVEADQSDYG